MASRRLAVNRAAYGGSESSQTRRGWIVAALIWAVLASAWIAFVPSVREATGEFHFISSGEYVPKRDKVTILQKHDFGAVLLIVGSIALAALPLGGERSSRRTAISGAALGGFLVLGSVAFGLYWLWCLPSALLLLVGAGVAELRLFSERL